jgi:phospholipase A1
MVGRVAGSSNRPLHQPIRSKRNGLQPDCTAVKSGLRYAIALLAVLTPFSAWAADVDMLLIPRKTTVQSGEEMVLDLYLRNNTADAVVRELPPTLPCRIDTGRGVVTVSAELEDKQVQSRVEIAGYGFIKRPYKVRLPADLTGPIRLLPETLDTGSITVLVNAPPPEASVSNQLPLDQSPALVQSYLDNFAVHEPMYFLLGVDPGLERSKFQLSFKYRLFNPEGWMAGSFPWISEFHLGYTQLSLWNLKDDSVPFEDTSYMPEVFYLFPMIDLHVPVINTFGIQTGFQHESNGKGGDDSRNTNYLYIQPILGMSLIGPFDLKIVPRMFTYIGNSEGTNDDLPSYRGYLDFEIGIFDPEGLALDSHVWLAGKGATVQVDLTFPMGRLFGKSLNLYLQAQYFSGYAETLLNYRQRHDVFRLGFSIVR